VRVTGAPASAFTPLVPASTATPRCEEFENAPGPAGTRIVSLVFGDPAEQRITVTLNADGVPVSYSDLRGDLIITDGREGDFTSIAVNLTRRQVVAGNRPDGEEGRTLFLPFDEAMSSPNLGMPREQIDRVLGSCLEEGGTFGASAPVGGAVDRIRG
jgi:hypothetical protein